MDGNALAACFDTGITDELVKEIAKRKPLRAVFRDAATAATARRSMSSKSSSFFPRNGSSKSI